MATLEKNRLVLRVAYAGPPLAGKTESIRMLLRLLRGKDGDKHVFSPGEARGRTIFFDWADYEAGTFQGNPIRCQITSVPGQAVLSARREALVKAADAVILVMDSRPEGLEDARRCYGEMAPWLAEADRDLEVRVVLQCNKQDLEGSLLPDLLRSRLGLPADRPSFGTSATTGKGLRPAFIAAVREALNRARTLTDRGLIRFGRPEIDSGEELLERLQRDAVATDASIETQKVAPAAEVTPEPPRAPPPVAPTLRTPPPEAPVRPAESSAAAIAPPVAPAIVPRPVAPAITPPPVAPAITPPPVAPPMRTAEPPTSVPPPPARTQQTNSVSSSPAQAVAAPRPENVVLPAPAAPTSVWRAPRKDAEPSASKPVRPAVMPATAWRAQLLDRAQRGTAPAVDLRDESTRTAAVQPSAPSSPAAPASPAVTTSPTLPASPIAMAAPSAPSARTAIDQAPIAQARTDVPPPDAVEPKPQPAPPPTVPARPPRPAVMPASAYRAMNAETQRHASATAIVAAAAAAPLEPSLPATKVADDRRDAAAKVPDAVKESAPKPRVRPAVMPASAFRAEFGDAAPVRIVTNSTTEALPAAESAGDAPRLPGRGLPDEQVCPVAIWRPLEPQMSPSVRAAADPRGGWHGEPVSGWYAHTIDSEADLGAARRLYDTAVSRHSALHRYLSKDRCLALTHDVGRWWIWQVVRKVPTLATRFNDWPRAGDSPEASAESLLDCAAGYWNALKAIRQAPEALPVSFEKVAPQDGGFVYAGLLPRVVAPPSADEDEDADFEDVLRKKLAVRPPPPLHVPAVLEELRRKATGRLSGPVLEMICSVLIGH